MLRMHLHIHIFTMLWIFCWQDALILYARLQLNLTRGATDGSILVEQLLDIVCKELDQSISSGGSLPWLVFP